MYVIGSGPAGVSCSKALLQQGVPVTMLDAGIGLDSDRTGRLQQLKQTSPADWTSDKLAFLKSGMSAEVSGIPLKLAYGSKFPYEDPRGDLTISDAGAGFLPSLARGGLSNVWGAAMLPYRADDISAWPLKVQDLAPHYQAVLGFMPRGCASGQSGRVDSALHGQAPATKYEPTGRRSAFRSRGTPRATCRRAHSLRTFSFGLPYITGRLRVYLLRPMHVRLSLRTAV